MKDPRTVDPDGYIAWLEDVGVADVALAGGKAASLGELIRCLAGTGALVPSGFVVTAAAYRAFASQPQLAPRIESALRALETGATTPERAAAEIGDAIGTAPFPPSLASAIGAAYQRLSRSLGTRDPPVAARSSATSEDLPSASFAGQYVSHLGVEGEEALLEACRSCFASLYTPRAMAYRAAVGVDHRGADLAVAVHAMVAWPECAAAGVMFTIDTETGFPDVIVVNSSWGLGEAVVQGLVTPDEFLVYQPALARATRPILARRVGSKLRKVVPGPRPGETAVVDTTSSEREALSIPDADVIQLARWGAKIASHYGRPMDVEWVRDGPSGKLGIVQARPETVHGARALGALRTYTMREHVEPLVTGISVGVTVASGVARVVGVLEDTGFRDGEILVTRSTSPDWVPLMRRAAAVVTDLGGRTSHAAIVSRELGVPAVVGTGRATTAIADGADVTVSCAEGRDGRVYPGRLAFDAHETPLADVPATRTKVLMNLSIPDAAFRWWRLPVDGVGLARIEFIVGQLIGAHPMALLHPVRVDDADTRDRLARLARGHASGPDYFVDTLSEGIACIAAAQHPKPVVVRLSDFKTNEYANLLGGRWFEQPEPNPMLGLRGASRYYDDRYREAFGLECRAIKRVREEMGLANVIVMIPFCRTVPECDRVLEEMAKWGLVRGREGLAVWLMCEVPSNVVLATEFAARIDGFSIGSNDLTQLVLGVDRDAADLRKLFDERDPAVKTMIRWVIEAAHAAGVVVSFCGQAPSDDPGYATFLVERGIDSISVGPDAVLRARSVIAEAEARLGR